MNRRILILLSLLLFPALVFAQIHWHESAVVPWGDHPSGLHVANLDGDGDLDFVLASQGSYPDMDGYLSCWMNNDGSGNVWELFHIAEAAALVGDPISADIDGDGDLDVACIRGDGEIGWWANLSGNGHVWSDNPVNLPNSNTRNICAADVDGDGDVDFVGTHDNLQDTEYVKWWENATGDGTSWTEHVIETSAQYLRRIVVQDMDGDGDADIVVGERAQGHLYWWDNSAGNGTTWTQRQVSTAVAGTEGIWAGDLDADGDADMVVADYQGNALYWFTNVDGSGTNWVDHLIAPIFENAAAVVPVDLDGDGDMDVVASAATETSGDVGWWENVDGSCLTWEQHMLSREYAGTWTLQAADMTGDDMVDVLSASYPQNLMVRWEQRFNPVSVTLTPTSPTDLPAGGGTLTYDVHIVSYVPEIYPDIKFWTRAKRPPNNNFTNLILYSTRFTLQPYMDITASLTQNIPSFAPAGDYELWGWVGFSPLGGPNFSGSFPFTKSNQLDGAYTIDSWASGGTIVADERQLDTNLPDDWCLRPVYPNPFNAMTTVTVELPEAANLSVRITNITGQQVADLARGSYQPGVHEFAFDATGLASGIYFVHATVPGQLNTTQKLVLMK